MDDEPDELLSAHRAAHNSAVLTVITVLFGVIWLADGNGLPTWVVSGWFLLVIPLTLYLMFMYRRRYHALLALHDDEKHRRDR
jgi:hypothetical protein